MGAVSEAFSGGEGLTYEDLKTKLGEMWESVEGAVQNAGAEMAQKACEYLMQDSSEGQMGEGIGWLAGTIAFEVALNAITGGTAAATKGVLKVVNTIARILDWTGEALGLAFKMLGKLGGLAIDLAKKIGNLINQAGGAAKTVLDAIGQIGAIIMRYADELLGKLGKGFAGEAAETATSKATKEVAETGVERTTRETAESVTERAAKETTEAGSEKAAQEAAEKSLVNDPEAISVLENTGSKQKLTELSSKELDVELGLADDLPRKQINEPPYVEEIELPNGHEWKRQQDSTWCRFSDPKPNNCLPADAQALVNTVNRNVQEVKEITIQDRKLDYLFNKDIKPDVHNSPRAVQNAQQLQKLGIYNDKEGRKIIREHLNSVFQNNNNIIDSYINPHKKTIEKRESLLAGPGGLLKVLSSWEVLPDGTRRLTSCQFFGKSNKLK
jgi:hypothetical protein